MKKKLSLLFTLFTFCVSVAWADDVIYIGDGTNCQTVDVQEASEGSVENIAVFHPNPAHDVVNIAGDEEVVGAYAVNMAGQSERLPVNQNQINDKLVIYISDDPTYDHMYEFLVKYDIGTKVNNFTSPTNFKKEYNIVYLDINDVHKARDIIRENAEGIFCGRCYIKSLGINIFENQFDILYEQRPKYDKSIFEFK